MRTNLLLKLMLFAGILLTAGCDKKGDPANETATYTLSCSKDSVQVDEEVTFTVKSSEDEDVTSDWNFYEGETQLTGNKATWSEPGSHIVSARSKTDPKLVSKNKVTVTVTSDAAAVTYTLSCDKTSVKINEDVTFTVTSSEGKNVTEEWNICDDNSCRIGNKFGWSKPGTYTLTAHCKEDPSIEAENTLTIEVVGAIYRLSADRQTIYVREEVTFSVTEIIDGVEQDKAPAGFQAGIKDGERFNSMKHTFTEAGVYTVEAKQYDYKGEVKASCENTVDIIVKEPDIVGRGENYYRRSLLAEATGTGCWTCPYMAKAIDYVMKYLLDDRIVPVAFHMRNDACNVEFADQFDVMLDDYKFYQYPVYIIDWNATYAKDDSMMKLEEGAAKIAHDVEASQARYDASKVPGLAIETSLTGRDLTIKIKTTPRETAEYFLGVYFIEDGVETDQNNGDKGRMIQNNVAHQCLTTGTGRNRLDELGTLEAEHEYAYDYSMTIPERHDMKNCRIIYYICKADESIEPYGYFCANATYVAVGDSADYEFEPIYAEPE